MNMKEGPKIYKPTAVQLAEGVKHINGEVEIFLDCYKRLKEEEFTRYNNDRIITECFLLHARCLFEFLSEKESKYDNILAIHYTGKHIPINRGEVLIDKINKQLSHIAYERAEPIDFFKKNDPPEKRYLIIDQIYLAIMAGIESYKNNMKTILVDAIHGLINTEGEIFEEMHEMLEEFPNRKIILTGADYEVTNQYGLNDAPYEVFTLKHDPEKTDPKYFEMMLEHFGLKADEVVYFEHGEEAVKSAQSVGIKTYFYDAEKKDLESLKKFLFNNLK